MFLQARSQYACAQISSQFPNAIQNTYLFLHRESEPNCRFLPMIYLRCIMSVIHGQMAVKPLKVVCRASFTDHQSDSKSSPSTFTSKSTNLINKCTRHLIGEGCKFSRIQYFYHTYCVCRCIESPDRSIMHWERRHFHHYAYKYACTRERPALPVLHTYFLLLPRPLDPITLLIRTPTLFLSDLPFQRSTGCLDESDQEAAREPRRRLHSRT